MNVGWCDVFINKSFEVYSVVRDHKLGCDVGVFQLFYELYYTNTNTIIG